MSFFASNEVETPWIFEKKKIRNNSNLIEYKNYFMILVLGSVICALEFSSIKWKRMEVKIRFRTFWMLQMNSEMNVLVQNFNWRSCQRRAKSVKLLEDCEIRPTMIHHDASNCHFQFTFLQWIPFCDKNIHAWYKCVSLLLFERVNSSQSTVAMRKNYEKALNQNYWALWNIWIVLASVTYAHKSGESIFYFSALTDI